MSENYSRRNHSSKEEKKSAPNVTEHVTKGFTVFQQQNGIEANFIAFQPGCSGRGSALGVREFWLRLVTP